MIWELVATALAALGVPYAADTDRSVLGDPLPDLFLVYFLISGAPALHADNIEFERVYHVQISLFSRSGLLNLPDTDTAMLAQGFQFAGETHIPFTPATGHYGLAREYTILLNKN